MSLNIHISTFEARMNTLGKLFTEELKTVYNAEKQSVDFFKFLISTASYSVLIKALQAQLNLTHDNIKNLQDIFLLIDANLEEILCGGMRGIIDEGNDLVKNKEKSHVCDAAIICIAQKICHYKMASYGALRNFAEHLDFDSSVIEYLQLAFNEEASNDRKLSKVAEGSFFSNGVLAEAETE